jgi:hypothetical protein
MPEASASTRVAVIQAAPVLFDFDPVGHHARPDVFSFAVDERARCGGG